MTSSFDAKAVELNFTSNQVLNLSFGFTQGLIQWTWFDFPFTLYVEMLQSVVMEVQRLYKSVMYINRKSVLYLYGISSVFDSKVCGFCRVESCAFLWWYQDLWLMNELLWVFKGTWQVFYKLCKGIKLRLEREKIRYSINAY